MVYHLEAWNIVFVTLALLRALFPIMDELHCASKTPD